MNLQWYFGPSASEEHGPKDSITTTFKGDKYYSLAREVIQNSSDAIPEREGLQERQPVVVKFSMFELNRSELPNFFNLKDTFSNCAAYFNTDKKFNEFCNEAIEVLSSDKIKCLRISDFNTTGLVYNDGKCPFYAFMTAVGYNHKSSSGAGGSFGFGKGAYYAASAIRAIIVSSVYGNNNFIFQGKVRLTTHKDENALKDYTGMFGNNGQAVTNSAIIPKALRRTEKGTDIVIAGFQDAGDWKESLIKSVINNFWLAIWEENLIVEVEGTLINKENLESIIATYYQENGADGSANEPETWNPYPYFKAVKFKDDKKVTEYFEEELPTLGLVKLYLLMRDNLPNRIVYMRSPKMIVSKKTENKGFSYAGVFVCDNKKGNEILRQMENPQHNEWKKNNYLENDKPHSDAKKAEEELKAFIKRCLESLVSKETGKRQKIVGLDKYLNIPEDLIAENEGDGQGFGSGDVSNEKTNHETSVEVTHSDKVDVKLKVRKTKEILQVDNGELDDDGDIIVGVGGGGNDDDPNTLPHPEANPLPGAFSGISPKPATEHGDIKVKKVLSVKCRLIAQGESNNIEHILKINSPKNATAEVELFAGVDSDSDSEDNFLTITSAMLGTENLSARGNKIRNIPLLRGWNELKIKFDSNQKHSLKIKAYEI